MYDALPGLVGGLAVAALMIGAGMWPALVDCWEDIGFAIFKARVRTLWRREVTDEDIIAATGESCWWVAYREGQSAREAVFAGTARVNA